MVAVSSSFDIYKIETIGDSFMAAGGLFHDDCREDDTCRKIDSDMAFAMIRAARLVCVPTGSGRDGDRRIHTESCASESVTLCASVQREGACMCDIRWHFLALWNTSSLLDIVLHCFQLAKQHFGQME